MLMGGGGVDSYRNLHVLVVLLITLLSKNAGGEGRVSSYCSLQTVWIKNTRVVNGKWQIFKI